mmetsp:Transcript_37071/g.61370  ORF Transcript_37071/g.61370 Transcript_37071/m.61370 type:complete len:166 (-) Transcript_37071:244-741(-)
MTRVINISKANLAKFDSWPPPTYYSLGCDKADRYLTAFVSDVVARHPLGIPAFHVYPQVLKTDINLGRPGAGFDFVGTVENLKDDWHTLFNTLNKTLAAKDMLQHYNSFKSNTDRCQKVIRPTTAELASLRPTLCALVESDYACFGEHYGTCDDAVDHLIAKYEA